MKKSISKTSKSIKSKVYFFSDVHLGAEGKVKEKQKEENVISFLQSIKRSAAEIYILGDLFDYWFEYSTVVPKGYYRLFTTFSELNEQGTRLYLVVGNHDYWAKSYFKEEFGMEIYHKPVDKVILGKRFYLHHGDGLNPKDKGYLLLKRILRNPINIFLYSLLHPDLSGKLAQWSSGTSRKYSSNRNYEENGFIEFAEKKINEGYDYIIMGHNHKAIIQPIGNGYYVNLGDWMKLFTYAVFDGKTLRLKQWHFKV